MFRNASEFIQAFLAVTGTSVMDLCGTNGCCHIVQDSQVQLLVDILVGREKDRQNNTTN